MNKIYLDNSATTKLDREVIKVMEQINSKFFGNPSSIHSFGQDARKIVDEARDFMAFYLNCDPSEIVFTSGGSESNRGEDRSHLSETKTKRSNKSGRCGGGDQREHGIGFNNVCQQRDRHRGTDKGDR